MSETPTDLTQLSKDRLKQQSCANAYIKGEPGNRVLHYEYHKKGKHQHETLSENGATAIFTGLGAVTGATLGGVSGMALPPSLTKTPRGKAALIGAGAGAGLLGAGGAVIGHQIKHDFMEEMVQSVHEENPEHCR